MDRRLETPHVFNGDIIAFTRFQVLVDDSKYLVVKNLELPDAINHPLQGLEWRMGSFEWILQ
jgi:hypothetical protein